jgi:hypothetical protein
MSFVGGVIGSLCVNKLLTSGTTARDEAVGDLLASCSEKEVRAVIACLKGRNRAAFLEIYQSYADEERAAQRSRARR